MGEIQAADGGGGLHGVVFRQRNPGVFRDLEQVPDDRFFRVVGAGRVAGGRADAPVFLGD